MEWFASTLEAGAVQSEGRRLGVQVYEIGRR